MPQRRKRSAAITLVLAGSLGGCSEPVPQRDVYTSLADCQRDWAPQGQQCEPVRDGRYGSSWYYGPRYYGALWPSGQPKASPSAVEAVRTPGTAATRTSSSSRSWSGSRSSSSTSRGGFGSSGRSSVS
ncbi:MAG TPA: hypothetical protein VFB93_09280 [Burkholderiales bacterium]|nr:hypothetical protein [Burkholderiales bacterium]